MTTFKTIAIIFLSVLFAATADVCNPSPCGASSCCADTLRGAMCYDKNIYQCAKDDNNGGNYLCSSSSRACNGVCYDATTYVCNSNGIAPKPKNTPTPTTSTTQSPTPTPTSSASAVVCPSWLTACGGACFRASDYCCVDGSLVKSSECKASKTSSTTSSSTTSTTKATTSSNAATSSTTKAATSSTTSSTTSTTSSKATTSAPVVINPTPAPVSSSNSQICNGQAYDSNLFGCSVVGKTESLCPAVRPTSPSKFWIEDITHNGMAAFNQNPSTYQVYRNVKSYGAKGDGVTDDTVAINAAITAFGRCGEGCDSSTVKPALVYFPQGTYRVSGPIIQYYMTQLVGDAVNPPTISALPNFAGMAIIDANPYGNTGNNWYTNQNNFYRQIRNFVIDTTATDSAKATTGIHWQVAQATSLLNIVFRMSTASNTNHQGIWMENGSGSFYSDLVFYGGKFGMWVGNQQFTVRNLTFYNAQTAVYMNWNWGWSFKSLHISGCKVGFDMSSTGGLGQQVGSINLLDAFFENTDTAIITSTTANTTPKSSGTLTLNNVRFSNVPKAVATPTGQVILAGKTGDTLVVPSWLQGYVVDANGRSSFVQGYQTAPTKPSALLDESSSMGYYFERQRPQYQKYAVSDFVNIKSLGAKGDGKSDDTAVIAAALLKYAGCKIVYFPSGTYLIKSTVFVPAGTRIVGEVWSQLMASGSAFSNEYNPTPMLRVGNPGDSGVAELSDLLFTAQGALPGAVLVEWNIKDPVGQKGVSGMWDCHIRIGGALGTGQQVPDCPKVGPTAKCQGIFLMVHLTPSASAYIENMWAWTADHDLDGNGQVSIFSARGVLIESQTALWLYGTASEHNVMYQYQMHNAKNVLGVYFQTETPYFQGSPQAPVPFHYNAVYNDPDYSTCTNTDRCGMAWGLRAIGTTSNVYIYGAGHYNFFDSYDQTCLDTEDCQDTMTDLSIPSGSKFYLYGLNTKAAITMVQSFGKKMAAAMDFRSTFCSTIHYMAAV